MLHDKIFRVIVLGGISLIGPAGCAMALEPILGDAAPDRGFPSELPVQVDVTIVDTNTGDAGGDTMPFTRPVTDAAQDDHGFPVTAPANPDVQVNDAADHECPMPQETAFIPDC